MAAVALRTPLRFRARSGPLSSFSLAHAPSASPSHETVGGGYSAEVTRRRLLGGGGGSGEGEIAPCCWQLDATRKKYREWRGGVVTKARSRRQLPSLRLFFRPPLSLSSPLLLLLLWSLQTCALLPTPSLPISPFPPFSTCFGILGPSNRPTPPPPLTSPLPRSHPFRPLFPPPAFLLASQTTSFVHASSSSSQLHDHPSHAAFFHDFPYVPASPSLLPFLALLSVRIVRHTAHPILLPLYSFPFSSFPFFTFFPFAPLLPYFSLSQIQKYRYTFEMAISFRSKSTHGL